MKTWPNITLDEALAVVIEFGNKPLSIQPGDREMLASAMLHVGQMADGVRARFRAVAETPLDPPVE